MDGRALQNALKSGRRLGVAGLCGDQAGELVVDVVTQITAQAVQVDTAGAQHGDRVGILGECKQ